MSEGYYGIYRTLTYSGPGEDKDTLGLFDELNSICDCVVLRQFITVPESASDVRNNSVERNVQHTDAISQHGGSIALFLGVYPAILGTEHMGLAHSLGLRQTPLARSGIPIEY